ncbi:MAG TPA: malonyl-[acyl-carrier protein] O-methyltransferase BioC, partial [Marinobacter sp.]|nr:malonyl-[acyl-carrier protein] O-methyltransferase BioC [Marinobacter sp.]
MSAYSDLTAIPRSEGGTGSKSCIARGFDSASGTY